MYRAYPKYVLLSKRDLACLRLYALNDAKSLLEHVGTHEYVRDMEQ